MVSPSASPATAASSAAGRVDAASTPARIRSWSARMDARSPSPASILRRLPGMHARDGAQLGGLPLRRRVVEEVAPADLGAREVLEQARLAGGGQGLGGGVEGGGG